MVYIYIYNFRKGRYDTGFGTPIVCGFRSTQRGTLCRDSAPAIDRKDGQTPFQEFASNLHVRGNLGPKPYGHGLGSETNPRSYKKRRHRCT